MMLSGLLMSGCGKGGDEGYEIEDYGGMEYSEQESVNNSDDREEKNDSIYEDDEYSVSVDLDWNDNLQMDRFNVKTSIRGKQTILNDDVKIYTCSRVDDFGQEEINIVEALFGKDYTKLESVSCSDGSSYIPLINKYKSLMADFEQYDKGAVDEKAAPDLSAKSFVTNYQSTNVSENEKFKWTDNDKYHIHMYEGNYNGERFSLLLAYDNVRNVKYTFFHPVDIKDYYPEWESSTGTVMLRNSQDLYGRKDTTPNNCDLSEEEVENEITEFLTGKLHMKDTEVDLGNGFKVYSMTADPFIGSVDSLTTDGESNADGISMVIFSDSDYLRTVVGYSPEFEDEDVDAICDWMARSVEILTNQDDPGNAQSSEDLENILFDFTKYISTDEMSKGGIRYTVDGYAMYLNPAFQEAYENNSVIGKLNSGIEVNSGVVEVTSKGIFSADIIQMLDIEQVEKADLADISVIKDAVKNALSSDACPERLSERNLLMINEVYFSYYLLNDSKYIPVWIYSVTTDDYSQSADIIVDAVTGELVRFE
ncbi:MAG: hypothetical protein J6O17_08690 [Eubacterium sp.]|nr:hypothetical protein [Eubacterium sp.]